MATTEIMEQLYAEWMGWDETEEEKPNATELMMQEIKRQQTHWKQLHEMPIHEPKRKRKFWIY